jgi:Cys-tRNA(Pro)/Cys-tRNA(Cys) deacylase
VAGTATPATTRLDKAGVAYRVHSYTHTAGAAYGLEAAAATGIEPARVFKTLVAEVDGALTVAIVPVAAKLDLKALAAAVGGKRAKMAEVGRGRAGHRLRRGRHLAAGPAQAAADRARR